MIANKDFDYWLRIATSKDVSCFIDFSNMNDLFNYETGVSSGQCKSTLPTVFAFKTIL